MKFYAFTAFGETMDLGQPLALCINREVHVPADDLTAVFPFDKDIPELNKITVTHENEEIFSGIADEQAFIQTHSGGLVKLSARSMAALLLDNEAMPQNYNCPGAADIFRRHIQPLGIREYRCGKIERPARFEVVKGATHWQVLETFCNACLGKTPAVDCGGRVLMCGYDKSGEPLLFGGAKGLNYTSVQIVRKRYKQISAVNVKTVPADMYTTKISDKDAAARGIKRERFLNISVESAATLACADTMIRTGKEMAFSVVLECPYRIINCMGRYALVDTGEDMYNNLYISKLQYTLSSDTEKTIVTLSSNREE